jgi:hypothetical protein
MNTDEHDDLWELLGRAKEAKASPFFSRNVLRAVRAEEPEKVGWLTSVRARWAIVSLGAAALVVATAVSLMPEQRPDPLIALANQVSASPDYQVISNLDELLDSERNSVWLEASAY